MCYDDKERGKLAPWRSQVALTLNVIIVKGGVFSTMALKIGANDVLLGVWSFPRYFEHPVAPEWHKSLFWRYAPKLEPLCGDVRNSLVYVSASVGYYPSQLRSKIIC